LEERAFLQAVGNLLAVYLLDMYIVILFSGVFIGLWILACDSLLNRGFGNSWARWAQLVALLVAFLVSLISSMQSTAQFAVAMTHLNSQPAAIDATIAPYDLALDWAEQIGLLISDIVVIWRAWVIYRDRP